MDPQLHDPDCDCMGCTRCDCYVCRLRSAKSRAQSEVHYVDDLAMLVMQQALEARTVAQCDRAIRILDEYLKLGGDESVRQVGSMVHRMRDALRLVADGRGDESDPSKLHLPPYADDAP